MLFTHNDIPEFVTHDVSETHPADLPLNPESYYFVYDFGGVKPPHAGYFDSELNHVYMYNGESLFASTVICGLPQFRTVALEGETPLPVVNKLVALQGYTQFTRDDLGVHTVTLEDDALVVQL